MNNSFQVSFPLVLNSGSAFSIMYTVQDQTNLEFNKAVYYLDGENGSGKTTFINMLALIAGKIGKKAGKHEGRIQFGSQAYNANGFDYINAAKIREKSFCIFPQKTFFLPVSTRDNYIILNNSEQYRAKSFSPVEYPDLLSGGQQQKILMDIILDHKKPVWFLDEPLANLDAQRRYYFWETLEKACKKKLQTIFFIDHIMGEEIRNDKNFKYYSSLRVFKEIFTKNTSSDREIKTIDIYECKTPEDFINSQIKKNGQKIYSGHGRNQVRLKWHQDSE